MYLDHGTCSPFQRWQSAVVSSGIWECVSVGRVAMTLKANRDKWLRRTVLPQGSQGACPPAPPELRAATARGEFRGSTRPRWPAGDRACAPASVAAARLHFLTPSSSAVGGAPSRSGRSHPPARALCRPPRPPCAGALRGWVTASLVGVARRRRAAAAVVAAAAPLSPPRALPAKATWLCVPPCALAAMGRAGVPRVDASPSAPPPWTPQGIARTCLESTTGPFARRASAPRPSGCPPPAWHTAHPPRPPGSATSVAAPAPHCDAAAIYPVASPRPLYPLTHWPRWRDGPTGPSGAVVLIVCSRANAQLL